MLEKKLDNVIIQLKNKVRSLCQQNNPIEPLILLTLEQLARGSLRPCHADAKLYEKLARQKNVQQGQLDLVHFHLKTLSGKAGDVITKALSKCLKKQKRLMGKSKIQCQRLTLEFQCPTLPLPSTGYQYPIYIFPASYGFQYPGKYPDMLMYQLPKLPWPYAMGRGAAWGQWRARVACLFCASTKHQVKDCQKMKLAKSEWSFYI